MTSQAPWLQAPTAVDQRFFVAEGIDGAYKCKTNRGSLQVWHRSPKNVVAPDGLKLVQTFSSEDPQENQIIELARQDPRHAIATHLGIATDELSAEDCPDSNRPGFKGGRKRFRAMNQSA